MDQIIAHLKESIEDQIFSKSERRSLKSLLGETSLNDRQLNVLRSKMYELAYEKANEKNYRFILEWIKNVNNTLITQPMETSSALFSPGEACRTTIINHLNSALRSIKICVFTISDDIITDSIIIAHKKGTDVQIVTDNDKMTDMGSDIKRIAREGIAIKTDSTPNHMHHKFMVVDETSLITGSYNWTRSAAKYNHENILVTKEVGLVRSYLKEFCHLWKTMQQY